MPNTPNLALPYPSLADAPNVPSHMQALASAVDTQVSLGAQCLGYTLDGTNMTNSTVIASPSMLNWPSIVIVTVNIPVTTRRVLVLGFSQISTTIVGNVEAGLFLGPAATAVSLFGTGTDPRIPNPTTAPYSFTTWGIHSSPPPGISAYALRAKNNAAGSFTSHAHAVAAFLI